MGFRGSVESALRQYATFRGRAPRSEYWWFYLFTVLVGIAASIVDTAAGTNLVSPLVNLALLLPSLAVGVRRLHDSNLSGWWLLAPVGCALLGLVLVFAGVGAALVEGPQRDQVQMNGAAVAFVLVGLLVLLAAAVLGIVLMVRSSTPGPNRFGPHPEGLGGGTPYGGPGAPQVDPYGNPYGQQYGGQYGGQYGSAQPGPYPGQYGSGPDSGGRR